ncbi:MAG TPA: hypothetical protein VF407_08230, partial [Polyangiaceae bacterium]
MTSAIDELGKIAQSERAMLAAVARSEGANAEDAVDCVQEALCTFLDLGNKNELPLAQNEWPLFLTGIVRNAARNRRRRHFRALPHVEISDDRVEGASA